jgi:hypothetical protein
MAAQQRISLRKGASMTSLRQRFTEDNRYLRIATTKVCSTTSPLDLLPHPVPIEPKPVTPQYF